MKIKHNIALGERLYTVEIEARKKDGKILIDPGSLIQQQRNLAMTLIRELPAFDMNLTNFLINVSGMKAKEIADLLHLTPALISKMRKGDEPSLCVWKFFLILMHAELEKPDRPVRASDSLIFAHMPEKAA